MRDLREWILDTMRRRTRRPPNDSESTGKIGQELPTDQIAPLRPTYPDALPARQPGIQEPMADASPDGLRNPEISDAAPIVGSPAVPAQQSADGLEAAETPEPAHRPEPKIIVETQPEHLGTPPAEAVAAKSPRGYVVLAIGLPGSGKTTWYKRRGVTPLSSDLLRNILFDDITEQRYQGLVFSTLRSLLRARLIAKMPWNYVDATNLSPHERRQWIKMAKSFGYEVQAVFFDVPLAVCMERNSKRERVVTDEVMQKMAERLRPPTFKEGFDKITVVRVKATKDPSHRP